MYDVIIVGAGVTGCAVARYLSRCPVNWTSHIAATAASSSACRNLSDRA